MYNKIKNVFIVITLLLSLSLFANTSEIKVLANSSIDPLGGVHNFDCSTQESAIPAATPRITTGNTTYYIGTTQVTSINQNPILASFTNGVQDWCRVDYEQTGVDGRGYGLLATPNGDIYAVFSVDGGSNDFNFGADNGWINSYGSGGGPKASVVSKINPANGDPITGSFITAKLANGNTNTAMITSIGYNPDESIELSVNSFFCPLDINKNPIDCSQFGSSPFDWRLTLNSDLTAALTSFIATGDENIDAPPNQDQISTAIKTVRTGGSDF
jgi:hypothetical protein